MKGGSCQLRNSNQEDDGSLISSLLRGYNKLMAPEETVTLQFGVYPVKIYEVDSSRGVLTVDLLLHYKWNDQRLSWNVEEHGYGPVFFRPKHIYVPEVVLYNGVLTQTMTDVEAEGSYTGDVTYLAFFRAEVYCHLPEPPFVAAICRLEIGPWTHDTRQTVLDVFDPIVNENFVYDTGLCFLRGSTAKILKTSYCCPNIFYESLVLSLNISCLSHVSQNRSVRAVSDRPIQQTESRNAKLSWHETITPFFVLLVFLLPPKATDRIFLGTMVFLALLLLWSPGYTLTAATQRFLHLSAGVIVASILASLVTCKFIPVDPPQAIEPNYEGAPSKTFACKSRLGVTIDMALFISAAIVLGIAAAGTFA